MSYTSYTVQQGDTIGSIAFVHGLKAVSVWNDPENAELKNRRGNPNLLFPGDILLLREPEVKHVPCSTEKRHRFTCSGATSKIHIRLLDQFDRPREALDYRLVVDGKIYSGRTNHHGELQHMVLPNSRDATLHLDASGEEFEIAIGHQDPLDTDTGVAGRLHNLGFASSDDEVFLEPALRRFQAKNRLEVTGQMDDATRRKLQDVYGH